LNIEKEDYDFLIDNCGSDWDMLIGKDLDDLVKKFKEIQNKYEPIEDNKDGSS